MAANKSSGAITMARSSSAQQSPTARHISRPSTTVADNVPEDDVWSGDIGAVTDYLRALKQTVGALGTTLEGLSDQSVSIFGIGPALPALHEVSGPACICYLLEMILILTPEC